MFEMTYAQHNDPQGSSFFHKAGMIHLGGYAIAGLIGLGVCALIGLIFFWFFFYQGLKHHNDCDRCSHVSTPAAYVTPVTGSPARTMFVVQAPNNIAPTQVAFKEEPATSYARAPVPAVVQNPACLGILFGRCYANAEVRVSASAASASATDSDSSGCKRDPVMVKEWGSGAPCLPA
jgi:hypothetical protein